MQVWVLITDRAPYEPDTHHGLYATRESLIDAINELMPGATIRWREDGCVSASRGAGTWRLDTYLQEMEGFRRWQATDYHVNEEYRSDLAQLQYSMREFDGLVASTRAELKEWIQSELDYMYGRGEYVPVPIQFRKNRKEEEQP